MTLFRTRRLSFRILSLLLRKPGLVFQFSVADQVHHTFERSLGAGGEGHPLAVEGLKAVARAVKKSLIAHGLGYDSCQGIMKVFGPQKAK